ncbi:flagellin [Clostridium algifaecis]|uniref:Flagellin n=1 Tax=Clostridium algifaecis TaxID=1472040 RepID=A0ABS4KR86_9CLOT|nr:flagellin [Clostridium algifaecis]MBP2031374.1 flagellin [Clostridium algifaecis]
MRISYNMPALTINLLQNQALNRQSGALSRISSGIKINSAADDPGAFVQSENIRLQVGGLQTAASNVQDGISMLQTAEGGLQEITSMVQRIKTLTIQAGDGATTQDDREKIQGEIDQMIDGVDAMAKDSDFNGLKMLSGNGNQSLTMQVGANYGESVEIPQYELSNTSDGTSKISELYKIKTGAGNDILSGNIDSTLSSIDSVLDTVVSARSKYGALENKFQSNYDNMQSLTDEMTAADSSIRDSDISEEIMNYSKEGIIIQASTAMIAQANKLPQDVLSILQNVK